MRRTSLCLVGSALILLVSCQSDQQARRQGCEPPALGFDVGAAAIGRIEHDERPSEAETPGLALRDSSAIIVGYCVESGDAVTSPDLLAGDDRIASFGGTLIKRDDGLWFNYAFYPPHASSVYELISGADVIGRVTFPRGIDDNCPLVASPPFHVESCGLIVRVTWHTRLPLEAENAGAFGISVRESHRGTNLSFFPEGVSDGQRGLEIHFGFLPPKGSKVRINLLELYKRQGIRDVSYGSGTPLHPVTLTLAARP